MTEESDGNVALMLDAQTGIHPDDRDRFRNHRSCSSMRKFHGIA